MQLLLLFLLVASLITFAGGTFYPIGPDEPGFTGWSWTTFEGNMAARWGDQSFMSLFGIFFPAATGIMAGSPRLMMRCSFNHVLSSHTHAHMSKEM